MPVQDNYYGFAGFLSPAYPFTLRDQNGAALNLTGMNIATMTFELVLPTSAGNQVISGSGELAFIDATKGMVSYQWSFQDMEAMTVGNIYEAYAAAQLPGDADFRAFHIGSVSLAAYPGGAIVSVQDVNLDQVNGQNIPNTVNGISVPNGVIPVVVVVPSRVNAQANDFAAGSIVDLVTANTHLVNIDTATSDLVTDLDALITNTGHIPTSPAQESGNLATAVARLTSILSQLQGNLFVEQTDVFNTGTISAAQPSINTPVSNASITLALGQGQSSFKAQLLAGTGGFTPATTIVVDGSPDGGTTWYSKSFKVSGVTPNNPQSSVVGPGPLELSGNAAGLTHIKVRCSVLNLTETINVRIDASAGVSDVGLLGSLPSGQNLIGYVEDIEQQGYIALTSPPAQTNAGSDTALTFSSQVNRVILENHTSANVYYAFDTAASAGSLKLVPGATLIYPKKCTVLHLFTSAVQNINGAADGNIVVLGAL